MPPISSEDAQELLRQFTKRDNELAHEDNSLDHKLEKAERLIRLIWALGAVIVAVTMWALRLQWTVSDLEKSNTRNTTAIESTLADRQSNQMVLQTIQNTIASNRQERMTEMIAIRADLETLKKLTPKVDEMWWMKEAGVSNKDAFERRNGYPPVVPKTP